MATLLTWRGWSVGNRLPVFDEPVPLPPLWSLPVFIPDQNREGTTPFRSDMDDRIGWSARARLTHTDRALFQVTHVDNRGDYELYGDEYSWKTLDDRDLSRGENSTEEGTAVTVAWLYDLTARIRTAVELTQVSGDSNLAAESGFDADTNARSLIVEVRYNLW